MWIYFSLKTEIVAITVGLKDYPESLVPNYHNIMVNTGVQVFRYWDIA